MAGNDVILVIKADNRATKELKSVGKQTDQLGSKFKTMGKAGAAAFAVAATAAAAYGVKSALSFSQSQAQVRTLISVTDQEFQKLNKSTLEFAGNMNIAAADASKALYDALSGGVQRSEVIPFLEDAARAAHAGGASLTEAVGILVQAQNVYGSTVLSAAEASDVLFEVIRGGITTLPQLGSVLGRVLPTAAALGVSFQDVGSSLSVMTSRTADTAGSVTRLNALFVAALRDSSKLAKGIKSELGGSFRDLIADGMTTSEIMQALRDKLPYDEFLQLFRRVEALNGALLITGDQNAPAVAAAFENMTSAAGATKTAFDKVAESAGFKIDESMNELKIAMLSLAEDVLPLLVIAVQKFTDLVTPAVAIMRSAAEISGAAFGGGFTEGGKYRERDLSLPLPPMTFGGLMPGGGISAAIIQEMLSPIIAVLAAPLGLAEHYDAKHGGTKAADEAISRGFSEAYQRFLNDEIIKMMSGIHLPALGFDFSSSQARQQQREQIDLDALAYQANRPPIPSTSMLASDSMIAIGKQQALSAAAGESQNAVARAAALLASETQLVASSLNQLGIAIDAQITPAKEAAAARRKAADLAKLWPPLYESHEAALDALIPLWDQYNSGLVESVAAQTAYERAVADAASEASSASTELTGAMYDQLVQTQASAAALDLRINLEDTYNQILETSTEELAHLNEALQAAIESGIGLEDAQEAYEKRLAEMGKDWDKSIEKTLQDIADAQAKADAEAERKREEAHREMMRINAIQVRLASKSIEDVAGSQELIGMTKKQMAVIYEASGLNTQARNAAQSGIGALTMGGVFNGMSDAQFAKATGQELGTRSTGAGAGYARIASQDPRFAHLSGQVARTNTVMALNPNDPNSPGIIVSAGGKVTVVNIAGNYIPLGPDTGDAVIEAANIAKDSRGTQFHTGIVADSQ